MPARLSDRHLSTALIDPFKMPQALLILILDNPVAKVGDRP